MSRIKGQYISSVNIKSVRWLEPSTGKLYESEAAHSQDYCHIGFRQDPDGTWISGDYVWQADAAPELAADWYVLRVTPDQIPKRPLREGGYPPMYTAFGPYTEAEARANAALRSEKSIHPGRKPEPYAVVQVQVGNTVVVQPPAPPKLVENWS